MPRPKAASIATATPARLLAAAEAEFAAAGFAAARLADVAARAGITRPSLLYHFATKEALYAAVVERAFGRIREAVLPLLATDLPVPERLVEAAGAAAELFAREPALARLLLHELLDGQGPGHALLVAQVEPLLGAVEAFIRRHARDGGAGFRLGRGLVRPGIMQVVAGALLRAVDPAVAQALWGPRDQTRALARALFLEETP